MKSPMAVVTVTVVILKGDGMGKCSVHGNKVVMMRVIVMAYGV